MRIISKLFITLFISLTSSVTFANTLIIEPDMGRKPVLDMIKHSKHNINLVLYGFTDKTLLNALLKQKSAGRSIKVILEDEPYKAQTQNTKAINAFKKSGIAWQGNIPPYRLIHQKTLITDNNKAMVMTFNFTHSAFSKQRNFAILIDDKKQVSAINNIFNADWNHKPAEIKNDDLIVSPDNSRTRLLALIKSATKSIDIYSQGLSDYETVGAIAKASKKGVTVRILTSQKLRKKQQAYLQKANVIIHQTNKLYIHAKVMIIDSKQVVLGSLNFTKPAFDNNRELSVISRDKKIVAALAQTFQHDWDDER